MYPVWLHHAYYDISAKYKRTFLGSLWIAAGMVATSIALSIMIGGLQRQSLPQVLPYIMGGMLCWAIPGSLLSEAPELYMGSASIIRNNAYPFTYYAFQGVTRTFILAAHNFVAYSVCMAFLMKLTVPNWSIIPGLILNYVNSFFWCSIFGMVSARFRDVRYLLPFSAQIIFFLTPVFWRPSFSSGWRAAIIDFNPFYGLMEIVRSPVLGVAAPAQAWGLALISLGVGALLWLWTFSAFRSKISFWV